MVAGQAAQAGLIARTHESLVLHTETRTADDPDADRRDRDHFCSDPVRPRRPGRTGPDRVEERAGRCRRIVRRLPFRVSRTSRYRCRARRRDQGAVRIRQAADGALLADAQRLCEIRSRAELLSPSGRLAAGEIEAAGVDLDWPVDLLPDLPDIDPARHCEGRTRGVSFRPCDEHAGAGRLLDSRVRARRRVAGSICRVELRAVVPAARADLGRLGDR